MKEIIIDELNHLEAQLEKLEKSNKGSWRRATRIAKKTTG